MPPTGQWLPLVHPDRQPLEVECERNTHVKALVKTAGEGKTVRYGTEVPIWLKEE